METNIRKREGNSRRMGRSNTLKDAGKKNEERKQKKKKRKEQRDGGGDLIPDTAHSAVCHSV